MTVSNDLKDLIIDWLKSGKKQITLFEDAHEIVLSRQASGVMLCVQMTLTAPDNTHLQRWMRLGGASLAHFQGALGQASASGALWLVQTLQGPPEEAQVLSSVESLLNQRDAWRAIFARLNKQAQPFKPTSLRSMPH